MFNPKTERIKGLMEKDRYKATIEKLQNLLLGKVKLLVN